MSFPVRGDRLLNYEEVGVAARAMARLKGHVYSPSAVLSLQGIMGNVMAAGLVHFWGKSCLALHRERSDVDLVYWSHISYVPERNRLSGSNGVAPCPWCSCTSVALNAICKSKTSRKMTCSILHSSVHTTAFHRYIKEPWLIC